MTINKMFLRFNLKYTNGTPAINGLKRISTPGLSVYKGSGELPQSIERIGNRSYFNLKRFIDRQRSKK